MATITKINGFNLGTDVRFAIKDDYGDVFSDQMLGHLQSFDVRSDDSVVKVTPITFGGMPVYQTAWNGNSGSMRFVRTGPQFSRFILDQMNAFHDGGIITQFTIAWTVRNRDGSTDQYTASGVQWTRPEHGKFAGLREVDMTLNFNASRIQATGALTPFLANLAGSY